MRENLTWASNVANLILAGGSQIIERSCRISLGADSIKTLNDFNVKTAARSGEDKFATSDYRRRSRVPRP